MKALGLTLLLCVGMTTPALATNYYISPTGSNSNDGLGQGAGPTNGPWLTFSKAFGVTGMANGGGGNGCGHTLNLMNGVYGDGTSTEKIALTGRGCLQASPMTIKAVNSRQARVNDSGNGYALHLQSGSNYIIIDGIVFNSTNDIAFLNGASGGAARIYLSNHVTVRNSLFRNPNKYTIRALLLFSNSTDGLVEDTEFYDFHRHAITFSGCTNMVARRVYAHPRVGNIPGTPATTPIGGADALVSFYPCQGCILENGIVEGNMYISELNASYTNAVPLKDTKILGTISLDSASGVGIYPNGRPGGADLNHSPQNITIQDVAIINDTSISEAVRCVDCVGTVVNRLTVIGNGTTGGTTAHGIATNDGPNGIAAAAMSFTYTNNIIYDRTGTGFYNIATPGSWSGSNNFSFSNADNYNPNLPSNWSTPTASVETDPGLGTCKVWTPAGSAAKTAGAGATILYRYVFGILTATPLWDPTTAEFPHGVTDLDGINDNAGESLFDVQTRLNVNTGGCPFPASYAGGSTPANPTSMVTSEGTTSTTHSHTIPVGTDFLLHCIVLWDDGGNVGSVASASSGGEALSLIAGISSSPAYRRAELWKRTAPTSGVRSQVVTTTGTVDGMQTTSIEAEGYSAIGGNGGYSAFTSTPTISASTNTNEQLYDCLAAKKGVFLTAGANQTLQRDDAHTSVDLRNAVSTQSGANGGIMSHTLASADYVAYETVSMVASPPDPPQTWELRQLQYRFHGLYGSETCPIVLPGRGAPNNVPLNCHPSSMFRLRIEVKAFTDAVPSIGVVLYCRKNAEAYAPVLDTFGSNVVRLYGAGPPGSDPSIPASLTPTTAQLTVDSDFIGGSMNRSEPSVVLLPALAVGKHTELEYTLATSATAGDTIDCRVQQDNGNTFTYTETPHINVYGLASGSGF